MITASVEDHSGNDHPVCLCSIHGGLYEAIAALGFLVGCSVHVWCSIFYLPARGLITTGGMICSSR